MNNSDQDWQRLKRRENILQLFRLMQPGFRRNEKYVDPSYFFRKKLRNGQPPEGSENMFRIQEGS
jgi:hypothetical protein